VSAVVDCSDASPDASSALLAATACDVWKPSKNRHVASTDISREVNAASGCVPPMLSVHRRCTAPETSARGSAAARAMAIRARNPSTAWRWASIDGLVPTVSRIRAVRSSPRSVTTVCDHA
jgi:hypothetical protein